MGVGYQSSQIWRLFFPFIQISIGSRKLSLWCRSSTAKRDLRVLHITQTRWWLAIVRFQMLDVGKYRRPSCRFAISHKIQTSRYPNGGLRNLSTLNTATDPTFCSSARVTSFLCCQNKPSVKHWCLFCLQTSRFRAECPHGSIAALQTVITKKTCIIPAFHDADGSAYQWYEAWDSSWCGVVKNWWYASHSPSPSPPWPSVLEVEKPQNEKSETLRPSHNKSHYVPWKARTGCKQDLDLPWNIDSVSDPARGVLERNPTNYYFVATPGDQVLHICNQKNGLSTPLKHLIPTRLL